MNGSIEVNLLASLQTLVLTLTMNRPLEFAVALGTNVDTNAEKKNGSRIQCPAST